MQKRDSILYYSIAFERQAPMGAKLPLKSEVVFQLPLVEALLVL